MRVSSTTGYPALGSIHVCSVRIHSPDQGHADISPHRQSAGRPIAACHTKIESTVCYLGIEVDDALAITEQIDV
jgi:hypothetical protein